MTVKFILKNAVEAKKMTDDLKHLVGDIVHDNIIREDCRSNNPVWKRISSLNERIAALKVHMDEITSLLERQEFFSAQLCFGGTLLIGVIIGLVVSSIVFLGH
ncbi:MAG TPA: hypothetical protein VHE99_11255 [Gammaproteobacteria bacterium]|nr:hypothetical protein [Gammaproteobacteria bacterium]